MKQPRHESEKNNSCTEHYSDIRAALFSKFKIGNELKTYKIGYTIRGLGVPILLQCKKKALGGCNFLLV
jgi:hypothetical protein